MAESVAPSTATTPSSLPPVPTLVCEETPAQPTQSAVDAGPHGIKTLDTELLTESLVDKGTADNLPPSSDQATPGAPDPPTAIVPSPSSDQATPSAPDPPLAVVVDTVQPALREDSGDAPSQPTLTDEAIGTLDSTSIPPLPSVVEDSTSIPPLPSVIEAVVLDVSPLSTGTLESQPAPKSDSTVSSPSVFSRSTSLTSLQLPGALDGSPDGGAPTSTSATASGGEGVSPPPRHLWNQRIIKRVSSGCVCVCVCVLSVPTLSPCRPKMQATCASKKGGVGRR